MSYQASVLDVDGGRWTFTLPNDVVLSQPAPSAGTFLLNGNSTTNPLTFVVFVTPDLLFGGPSPMTVAINMHELVASAPNVVSTNGLRGAIGISFYNATNLPLLSPASGEDAITIGLSGISDQFLAGSEFHSLYAHFHAADAAIDGTEFPGFTVTPVVSPGGLGNPGAPNFLLIDGSIPSETGISGTPFTFHRRDTDALDDVTMYITFQNGTFDATALNTLRQQWQASRPVITGVSVDTGLSPADHITRDPTPVLTGTSRPGAVVSISDGNAFLGNATADGGGHWSFAVSSRPDGVHLFSARSQIAAAAGTPGFEEVATSADFALTIDNVAPTAPTISGFGETDHRISLTGTAEAGAALTVRDATVTLGITVANADGFWNFLSPVLDPGAHVFSAVASDAAGNISANSSLFAALVDDNILHPNVAITGLLNVIGDRDSYAIKLVAGQNYQFEVKGQASGGGSLSDPYVRLYDHSKVEVASDDDSGTGLDALLVYSAQQTGIYYLEAARFADSLTGSYTLTAKVLAPTDDHDGNWLFDTAYYNLTYSDVARAGVNALQHYNSAGWHEGRDPNFLFDTNAYLAANPDVRAAGVNPLAHFDTSGWREGRDPSAAFDTSLYRVFNPDVAAAGVDPLVHFLQFGQAEGRKYSPVVDSNHIANGIDPTYYRLANPDVARAQVDPLVHYSNFGWREGRDPNVFFDTSAYLEQNPDVRAAGVDPLVHYMTFGWHEHRNPSTHFNTDAYLSQYTDVAQAGLNPLDHFLHHGLVEGRSTFGDWF